MKRLLFAFALLMLLGSLSPANTAVHADDDEKAREAFKLRPFNDHLAWDDAKVLVGRALKGDADAGDKALHSAGLIAQNAVRNKITEGPFVPLAPMTLAKRKARGRTGEKPLIDSGAYRNAQTYVIRPKGED